MDLAAHDGNDSGDMEAKVIILDESGRHCSNVDTHVCDYHKKHPLDTNYPGCTCTSTYSIREKTHDEILDEIIEERADVLRELAKL